MDDDPALRRVLSLGLGARGHTVFGAADGRRALLVVATAAVDVVVLDLGLPDIDGLEICARLRESGDLPVVVLSADASEARKVAALDGGADDYVTKPFGMDELDARLRLAARHFEHRSVSGDALRLAVGELVVDVERHAVTVGGTPVELTPREFDLLGFLARHAGKVLTHRMILAEVWGPAYVGEAHYLRVYVHRLRRAIGDESGTFLRTVPGVGYALASGEDAEGRGPAISG
ncbi:MAG: response regulator transcription factor [Actinomycetota bacterium]|nr:response regulator transcription factor [Actinomycetota bacterium]